MSPGEPARPRGGAGAGPAGGAATAWTARTVLEAATGVLAERGVEDARLDATLLLAHALGLTRLALYMQMDRPLGDDERARYRALIRERARRVPVAYLVGSAGFFALDLTVTRDVLIPRPDTERLVELALDAIALAGAGAAAPAAEAGAQGAVGLKVADVCTGSGAIAIALAKHAPAGAVERIFATDASEPALAVARANAERHGVLDRIELLAGDLEAPLIERGLAGALDLVAANPPYVAEGERAALAPELAHEPALALFAGADGLAVVRRLVAAAGALLRPGGLLLVEIGHAQGAAARALAEASGLAEVAVLQDLDRRDRVLSARRPAAGAA